MNTKSISLFRQSCHEIGILIHLASLIANDKHEFAKHTEKKECWNSVMVEFVWKKVASRSEAFLRKPILEESCKEKPGTV